MLCFLRISLPRAFSLAVLLGWLVRRDRKLGNRLMAGYLKSSNSPVSMPVSFSIFTPSAKVMRTALSPGGSLKLPAPG